MTETVKLTRLFKALSVTTRLEMIELLKHRSLCVNSIAKTLGITSAAVSQHLRVLRDADLVVADRRGYFVHYRVNREALDRMKDDAVRFFQHEDG
ncbi:MAG: metalloregulator ArsR/SmtB family transcription factor [Chlorobium sp.]|uniref:ArsR/SmtB family transcription factor n=1 Tax=Chlorobium sp. TaxID=1095 RepID=UPI0025BE1183|nr:metalloregulator ArsR/SmtB family transcription factor [Chlorobium sp.]MCF8383251.1 metalloregulator ArsR/SmtB family transcription factor [Chlorobium sp.]